VTDAAEPARAAAIDLDAVLGDTRPLWDAWLEDARRRLRVDVDGLPEDRRAAAAALDEQLGNWRTLLERFAAEHAPVHLRPDPQANALLRALGQAGVRVGAFTDAPAELARAALVQLGATRSVTCVGTLDEVRAELGEDAVVVPSREALATLAPTRG
jgi:phosphoglycolate phosphatase-like HAD superfamily hydrolase